ncbi:MAG: hypothetical protein JXR94_21880 [Candidatus Hydrogenedentes bacterium]|nr:hypothetical protein [Candidatus Hydrogenedentota bacterium]
MKRSTFIALTVLSAVAASFACCSKHQGPAVPNPEPGIPPTGSFLESDGTSTVTVFPAVVRTFEGVAYSQASREAAIAFLKENRLGVGQASDTELDLANTGGGVQWNAFQNGIKALAAKLPEQKLSSDYVMLLEFLVTNTRSGGVAVGGIECYLLEGNGANACSFLLNSHHSVFTEAGLSTADLSPEAREQMIMKGTAVALAELRRRVAEAKKGA